MERSWPDSGRVGKGDLALSAPAESKQPTVPRGFGGHGAKRAFAHPLESIAPPTLSLDAARIVRRRGRRLCDTYMNPAEIVQASA
jgi:hypothetical protein